MKKKYLFLLSFLFFPLFTWAHGSHGSGIMSGFTHPIFGYDHLVTILAMGVLSYFTDAKGRYIIAIAFLLMMLIASFLGLRNGSIVFVEQGVAISSIVIGALMLFRKKMSITLAVILAVAIAFFHGYAHGTEKPEDTSIMKYTAGFLMATTLLLSLGSLLAHFLKQQKWGNKAIKILAVITMALGIYFYIKQPF